MLGLPAEIAVPTNKGQAVPSGHDGRLKSYKAGQQLYCKVLSKVNESPEGYFVTVVKTGEVGFLQTKEVLTAGAEIVPTFLYWTPGGSYLLFRRASQRRTTGLAACRAVGENGKKPGGTITT